MTDDRQPPAEPGRIGRPYVLTGGRTRPVGELELEALVIAGREPEGSVRDEFRAIAAMAGEPISLAEIAARLDLPLGVARVLVADMAADGLLELHRPHGGETVDVPLLERVLSGLRRL
jgi:hypothetical protein